MILFITMELFKAYYSLCSSIYHYIRYPHNDFFFVKNKYYQLSIVINSYFKQPDKYMIQALSHMSADEYIFESMVKKSNIKELVKNEKELAEFLFHCGYGKIISNYISEHLTNLEFNYQFMIDNICFRKDIKYIKYNILKKVDKINENIKKYLLPNLSKIIIDYLYKRDGRKYEVSSSIFTMLEKINNNSHIDDMIILYFKLDESFLNEELLESIRLFILRMLKTSYRLCCFVFKIEYVEIFISKIVDLNEELINEKIINLLDKILFELDIGDSGSLIKHDILKFLVDNKSNGKYRTLIKKICNNNMQLLDIDDIKRSLWSEEHYKLVEELYCYLCFSLH